MKILFVRTFCPSPIPYGSELRSSQFVEYFRSKGEVDLLTLTRPRENTADMNYINGKFRKFHYFDQQGTHPRLTPLEKLAHLVPWQITGHYAKDFQKKLNAIVEENGYDLIFVFKLEPVLYFLKLARPWREKTVVDFDDILSELYRNHYRDNAFVAFKNSRSLRLYEHRALMEFRRVFVCSRDAVMKMPPRVHGKIGIAPNVFEARRETFFPPAPGRDRLLYVGSLDYHPNIEGLRWFFDAVWPQVKKTRPELKLTVIGKSTRDKEPGRLYSSFGNPADVTIDLNVPSVVPYYRDCFTSVVPLLNGSGTRLKILESAAFGRPVLTTLKGMEGLDYEDGQNIFIFKDAASFLDGYNTLLDAKRYEQLAEGAFQVLKDSYSPAAFVSCMDRDWSKIVG